MARRGWVTFVRPAMVTLTRRGWYTMSGVSTELAGIEENITSYAARHSFASGANEMGIPLTAISQMLGHKRISTTQAYLANLRKSKMDEYQDEIFGQLSSE